MKTRMWNVCLNGRMPPLRQFQTFDEAVSFVSAETGVSEHGVRTDNAAGCPTIRERDEAEFDIEKARE